MEKTYDATKAIKAQEAYCDEHEIPLFAPRNGWCTSCGRNIFEPYTYRGREDQTHGITVEEAGSRHIREARRLVYDAIGLLCRSGKAPELIGQINGLRSIEDVLWQYTTERREGNGNR